MRIKIIHQPQESCIDGMQLDRFVPGFEYEVGSTLGAYLLAMGWAEPPASDELATPTSVTDMQDDEAENLKPSNLHREFYPPYYDGPQIALDRRRLRRRRT
jgi:hypothetical protein